MSKAPRREGTFDGIEILRRRYVKNARDERELQEARESSAIARQIYDLRNKAGLSQRGLARLVGTTASVICRLEDDDYDGHSLTMLRRIAAALGLRVQVRFVRVRGKASA